MTSQQSLEWDANTVMEQIHMAESRHMQMGALCSYLLQYPDMTIRDFFAMASEEIREEEEELGYYCLLYTSPSPRDLMRSRMPSSA